MQTLLTIRAWGIFAALWAAFVALLAWQSWPRMPLDSGNDANSAAALQLASDLHLNVHLGLALIPPLVLLALGWLLRWLRGPAG
jgi:hypothetical protein